jgi:P-type conjugative transfer protein TrbJ
MRSHARRTSRARRTAVALAALLAVLVQTIAAPSPAAAQIPVTDVAHIAANVYYQYIHYVARYYEIQQKAQQILYQLQALKKLANPSWRDVGNLLVYLNNLMREGETLAYSLDNLVEVFRETFPGWLETKDWPTEYRAQVVRTLNTMERALRTVNQQSRGFSPKDLGRIKAQVADIEGHQEALELLATIGAYNAEELLLMRQSFAAANNIASVYYASQVNEKAQAALTLAAATRRTLAASPAPAASFTTRPAWWPFH